ncbi:MAG: hypothetical protein DWQ10_02130 [Calditrichaeota bacterium]|nr:MAG: hypothetical protein DWQ10_02130 [Calditrichota bacterium]
MAIWDRAHTCVHAVRGTFFIRRFAFCPTKPVNYPAPFVWWDAHHPIYPAKFPAPVGEAAAHSDLV